ncbi:transcription elongation factor GreA [candidate division WWE3 bacterium RIFOXYC2_FULL_42_13]|uniref:Transcription elongation factor GreA n=1 Tax=candidate division WWE3 bacterium TaxID=2053526 RepID=A0A3D0ZPA9_UNCKA|nr:MAG: transcription elongation factor GreA [candidate division WWE3 bacterium RIFOXYA2_FULL_43_12]OGC66693.1 MAG: transcription elongation factor GreA [candidate division WWE3 bacterium RIFOXYA12_FULL_43_11]OGC72460.1 MAG: transcription elongation factor GreA [candidate division WWE3 bacterium RIFOXYC2_FULL_42_13]OGC73365.1 MAG: transcription elongation factor GreA [candidate division WWE3 bacterium RIFOXYB2_FULL_43_9]OGC75748.1 MAG: transcription elongation factor GreA [candidate division WW
MEKKDVIYVTKEGLAKLKAELAELNDVKRPEVARRIKEAREMGDISENSEYDAAKQEQSYIEGRISELEEFLKNAEISKDNGKRDIIGVGAMVKIRVDSQEIEYHIVGAPEANPLEKKISHESPLGAALVGKKVGDKIEVDAPVGKLTYTILKIDY